MQRVDLSSKRARLALRFFTYGVMTLATALLTTLAVFYAMGYRFDQNARTFEQGGLVQLRTVPDGAGVYVDGKAQNVTTPSHLNLTSGKHTVEMRLGGYRTWQKTINLAAGQLLWLDYARLLPATITTTAAVAFDGTASAIASPDHKWMATVAKADQPVIKLVNFSDEKKPTASQIVIPDAQFTKNGDAPGQFIVRQWDQSSRYILVEHVADGVHEFLRLDRQNPTDVINLGRAINMTVTAAQFAFSNPNTIYLTADATLYNMDVGAKKVSSALEAGVDTFTVTTNDTVAFVATRNAADGVTKQRIAGIYQQGKEIYGRTFAEAEQPMAAYAEYAHHTYAAVKTGNTTVDIVRDPSGGQGASKTTVTFGSAIAWMKFSDNGRMLALGNGNSVATYDLDIDKLLAWTVPGPALTQPLQWLDDYYLWSDTSGKLTIYEYDGTNDREITSVTPGLTAGLAVDGAYLYSFNTSASGEVLQSSQLVKN